MLEDWEISQARLAKHIGVEPGVINLICKGKRGNLGGDGMFTGVSLASE